MTLRETKVTGQRFQLGKTVITRGALTHCEDNNIDSLELLMRHAAGDFGTVGHLKNVKLSRAERQHGAYATDDGLKLNAVAILDGKGMVMSIYQRKDADTKIWIQTMLADEETYTTILLPSEY